MSVYNMLALNDTIDFDFFEDPSKSSTERRQEVLKKDSIYSTDSFLDLWSYETRSVSYSGSHASLLNSIAFETEIPKDTKVQNSSSPEETLCDKNKKVQSVYEEIKKTIAFAPEQENSINSDEDVLSDVSPPSLSPIKHIDNLTQLQNETTETQGDKQISQNSTKQIIDRVDKNQFNLETKTNQSNVNSKINLTNEISNEKNTETHSIGENEVTNTRCSHQIKSSHDYHPENKSSKRNSTSNDMPKEFNNVEHVSRRNEKITPNRLKNENQIRANETQELDKKQNQQGNNDLCELIHIEDKPVENVPSKQTIKIWHRALSDDDILYKGNNMIMTVVEVHAENDLYDDVNQENNGMKKHDTNCEVLQRKRETESSVSELKTKQEEISQELDKQNTKTVQIISKESHREKSVTDNEQTKFKVYEVNDNNVKTKDTADMKQGSTDLIKTNEKNGDSSACPNNLRTNMNELNENLNLKVIQNIETIKIYNERNNYNIDLFKTNYKNKYEEIEKKIENANVQIITVKDNSEQIKKETSLHRPVIDVPFKSVGTKSTKEIKDNNTKTRAFCKSIDILRSNKNIKVAKISDKSKSKQVPSETNVKQLPKLQNKPLVQIKPRTINRVHDKIPEMKNEGFDMKLLIRAINDLDHTTSKRMPPVHQRSNSGRSSDVSSNKSSSSSKRSNMSFTKEEQKKIDRENEILLKKIMKQKPQQMNLTTNVRRKPSAYINRQRQQDRILHDNTILKRKIQSIQKRKDGSLI